MNRPAVFYHYAIKDDLRGCFWSYWLDEQLGLMEASGISKHADVYMTITMPMWWKEDARGIRITRNKTHDTCTFVEKVVEYIAYKFPWINILEIKDINEKPNLYEGVTLRQMWTYSKENPDRAVGYVHAKGIFSVSPQVKLWRELLNEIHIKQWRQRVYDLRGYDVVAMADVTVNIEQPSHVSGNFFWTTTNYVASLPMPLYIDLNGMETIRYEYEKWIMTNTPNMNFVYNSETNHFMDYPNE